MFKNCCLPMPGSGPHSRLVPCPSVPLHHAVQYHKTWEVELLQYIRTELKDEVVVPGPAIEHTRHLLREFGKDAASHLVEELGRQPRFGVPWYQATTLASKTYRLSTFIQKDKKPNMHYFSSLTFWQHSGAWGKSWGLARTSLWRCHLTTKCGLVFVPRSWNFFALPCFKLNSTVGLVVVDKGTAE